MPLVRRLPKRGFTNIFRKEYAIVNLAALERLDASQEITPALLVQKGLVRARHERVKVLGTGTLTKALTVRAHKFSRSAVKKIEAAEGKVQVIERD
jgi:large subunit ribosomal protein L15